MYLTAYSFASTFPRRFKLLISQRNHLISSTVAALNGGIYIQATRGVAPRNHSFPTPEVKPVIMAFAKSYDRSSYGRS
jgi:hypothetical protein